jgi:hypothetical protein
VLGQFRTSILDAKNLKAHLDITGIPEYESIKQSMASRYATSCGKQPGDPKIAAERIVDIARLENLSEFERGSLLLRIPLGGDAIGVVRRKCEETMRALEGWEEFAKSTDFKDGSAVAASYQ